MEDMMYISQGIPDFLDKLDLLHKKKLQRTHKKKSRKKQDTNLKLKVYQTRSSGQHFMTTGIAKTL